MRELVGRLEALDPDAGAALRVITYFDELVERRAGLENVVRGAAVLSGHPAILIDVDRGLRIRVLADGTRTDEIPELAAAWCRVTVDTGITVCLEHPQTPGPVEAIVLERAAMAARTVLDRTRSKARPREYRDAELVEVLLDATAPETDRLRAVGLLGLPADGLARVVAFQDGSLDVVVAPAGQETQDLKLARTDRAGLGPAVPPLSLPATAATARAALRFTAEDTAADPGPRVVAADDLGGLLLLAQADQRLAPVDDVQKLERAATATPWMLLTLQALVSHASLRATATALTVHHSTLQERVAQAETLLGWSLRDVSGQTRLNVALMLRRLQRNAPPA